MIDTAVKRKRAYGVSCLACRQKKRSCDGKRPRCTNCLDGGEEDCVVPQPSRHLRRSAHNANPQLQPPPPKQQPQYDLAQLHRHVHALEERVRRLEEPSSSRRLYAVSDSYISPTVDGTHLEDVQDAESLEDDGARDDLSLTAASEARNVTEDLAARSPQYKLTVDENGNVTYHGCIGWDSGQDIPNNFSSSPTPSFQLDHFPFISRAFPSSLGTSRAQDAVAPDSSLSPIFRALATSKHISVAPDLGDALLNAFFCYQVFEIPHQTAFLRDMAFGGSCFSEFLLMVLYACASRMIDGLTEEQKLAQGDLFVGLAKAYLAKELEGPSKITTIQGLLLLSGRECALGDVSQGWNHAGLAFRMIQDLGIHHAPESVSGVAKLSIEEQATRERIYWAAFIWDKALSLALGREPTFPPRSGRDPSTIPDFDDDYRAWVPYFVHSVNCPPVQVGYIYQPARRVTAFRILARLCLIIHDIIMRLYSSENRDNDSRIRNAFVTATRQRLDDLWQDAPEEVKFNSQRPSAPPHIFMLQMLYHATYILLHRPTITAAHIASPAGPAAICITHSTVITQIAVKFSQTFDERLAYVARYAWFVAAGFDVVLLETTAIEVQIEAMKRLNIWLRMMQNNILRAPSIRRSVQHIASLVLDSVNRNPNLATSETGSSIRTQDRWEIAAASTQQTQANNVETFDFFDILQST